VENEDTQVRRDHKVLKALKVVLELQAMMAEMETMGLAALLEEME
jgi:hypothetical protein